MAMTTNFKWQVSQRGNSMDQPVAEPAGGPRLLRPQQLGQPLQQLHRGQRQLILSLGLAQHVQSGEDLQWIRSVTQPTY